MPNSNVRRHYPKDIDIVSVTSSNITEDNRPGPGRILGNVYSSLGRRLEGFLNSLAERQGLGPEAVALRIRQREYDTRDRRQGPSAKYSRKEAAEQQKDIRKLVRYAKSKTESTRKQALEEIIECAWHHDYILDLLQEAHAAEMLKRQETYIWDFCDTSLQISSRMAYASVREGKIFSLVKRYENEDEDDVLLRFIRNNPEESFLAFRLLARFWKGFFRGQLELALKEVEKLIDDSPDLVEWDEIDKLFECWFTTLDKFPYFHTTKRFPVLIWRMCRSGARLPRTFQSDACKAWISALHNPKTHGPRLHLARLVSAAAAEGISVEDIAQHKLAPAVQPFLSPPDLLLCWIAEKWGPENGFFIVDISCSSEEVFERYKALAKLADSQGISIKRRAVLCITNVLDHDIYTRAQMLRILASNDSARSTEYLKLMDSTGRRTQTTESLGMNSGFGGRTLHRHYDKQGNFLHVPLGYNWSGVFKLTSSCTDACHIEQDIFLDCSDVIQLMFHRTPVQVPTWANPILAGQCPDGRRFIAQAFCKGLEIGNCDIVEGTRPEYLRLKNENGKVEVPDSIGLLVLRHAPHAYPDLALVGPNGERTMDLRGDISGYAAEITHIEPNKTCYRLDSEALSAYTVEIQ